VDILCVLSFGPFRGYIDTFVFLGVFVAILCLHRTFNLYSLLAVVYVRRIMLIRVTAVGEREYLLTLR
jgi:hypothetical protein